MAVFPSGQMSLGYYFSPFSLLVQCCYIIVLGYFLFWLKVIWLLFLDKEELQPPPLLIFFSPAYLICVMHSIDTHPARGSIIVLLRSSSLQLLHRSHIAMLPCDSCQLFRVQMLLGTLPYTFSGWSQYSAPYASWDMHVWGHCHCSPSRRTWGAGRDL